MATGPRLLLTDAAFLVFCTKLGDEREAAGAGPAARISIGQRADVLQVIHGLNTSAGWLAPGASPDAETAETIFARHLAPVLCENPLMRDALDRVLAGDGVPGTFRPALPRTPKPPVVNPAPVLEPRQSSHFVTYLRSEFRWKWQGLRGVLRFRAVRFVTLMAGLAAVLTWGVQRYPEVLCHAPVAATWLRSQVPAPGCGGATIVVNPVALPGRDEGRGTLIKRPAPRPTPVSQDIAALGPLDRALSVLEVAGFDMSPALLAQHLATTAPVGLDPALYLDAMLTRWPMPADQPIPRSKWGAMALVNFGLAAAVLEGDRGALAAIRERLTGMTAERSLAVSQVGQYLPDLDFPEEENIASLSGLVDIDPRLAWFAVDDVARELFALHLRLTTKILSKDIPALRGSVNPPGGSNFAPYGDPALLEEFAREAKASFGITLRFDPVQAGSLTFHDVLTAVRAGLQQATPLDTSFEMPLQPWRREVGLVPLGIPLLMLLWAVLGYPAALRRRLQHWPRPPLPGFHLIVPAPDRTPVLTPLARRVARTLRHTAPRVTASLDVEASLARTLRQGGYFTPVLRQRRNVAAHVVLIHRRTLAEHEPRRIAALFGQMAAVGVSVSLFEYAADPARVRPFGDLGGQTRDLSGLLQDDPEARLILVTSGDEFTGAGAYGVSAATVQTLLQWDQRAVVTPVPVGNWGLREWALSDRLRLPLARAGPDGLPDLAAIFPADPARAPVMALAAAPPTVWLRKLITRRAAFDPIPPLPRLLAIGEAEAAMPQAPRPDRLEAMALTLKRWLGPEGYLWLQACAFYPVLRYPLTRWLGSQLFGPQASTRTLAQLTQLGWFAVGRMPTGLAARLRQGLSDVDRARIDAIFTRFYLTRQADGASPAQDAGRGYRGERVAYEPDTLASAVEMARLLPAELAADPKAGQQRVRLARLAVLADRGAAVLAAGLMALVLWAVWPDRTALPLPPAAWLPAIVVVVVGAVLGVAAMATLTALRRTRRGIGATGIKSAEPQA